MKSARPLKVAGSQIPTFNANFTKTVKENRNCVPTVNWSSVSVTCFSNTEVLLTPSRLRNVRQTLCKLTSNLMFQTPITCVNTPLSLLRV